MSNNNKTPSVRFKCPKCPKSFSSTKSLTRHTLDHMDERPFSCEICEKKFSRKDSLTDHKIKHNTERPFKCETCGSAFKTKVHVKNHQNRIHSAPSLNFVCKKCPKRFKTQQKFTIHKSSHSDEKPFQCDICDSRFKQKYQLQTHLKSVHSNDPSFNCKICGKRCKTKGDLSKHMKIHTREKPHKCSFCENKEFITNGALERHIKAIHSGIITLLGCELCPKKYQSKDRLRYHLITEHNVGDNPESWVCCTVCQKSFGTNGELRGHMRRHILVHKCGICGKGCPSKSQLQIHISAVHTKEKPNKCYFCFISFTTMEDFFNHLRIHTKERPFKCSVCDKNFTQWTCLKDHLKRHKAGRKVRNYTRQRKIDMKF